MAKATPPRNTKVNPAPQPRSNSPRGIDAAKGISNNHITEKTSLRSRFNFDQNNRLGQVSTESSKSANSAYFPGGFRDLRNICTFTCNICTPKTITLYLSPNNVSWNYSLKTNVIDTYGGQVIQILGVSIDDLTIQGFFGSEGMWGYNLTNSPTGRVINNSRFEDSDGEINKWKEEGQMIQNGLYQFSQWFKTYFYQITQQGNWNTSNMTFSYPHMGWEWHIRPLAMPRVRFANNELAPQWQLQCDFVENFQGTFTEQVSKAATERLASKSLPGGIGFSQFISWSEPVYKNQQERSAVAGDIGTKYSEFISQDLTDSQLKTLITQGYSYPASNKDNIEAANARSSNGNKNPTIAASISARLQPLLDVYS
jgi:hypothetical protein